MGSVIEPEKRRGSTNSTANIGLRITSLGLVKKVVLICLIILDTKSFRAIKNKNIETNPPVIKEKEYLASWINIVYFLKESFAVLLNKLPLIIQLISS